MSQLGITISQSLAAYRRLPRSLWVLFFARIVNNLGAFVYPFLTLLLTQRLGLRDDLAGLLVTLAVLTTGPGILLGGKLADRFGRRQTILLWQGLAAAALIPCAFLGASLWVPFLLIASNLFSAIAQPAHNAMATDLSRPENRKPAFALLYLGINIGYAIGPLLAGFLFNHYIEWLFLGDALTTFLSLFLILRFVPETTPSAEELKASRQHPENPEQAEEGHAVSILLRRPTILLFGLASILYAFVYSQIGFSLPLYANDVFGSAGPTLYGSLMTVSAVVVVVATTLVTSLTMLIPAVLNVALAGLFYALGFGLLALAGSYGLFVLAAIFWTLGEILTTTNASVYIADHTPISHRGRFTALLALFPGVGYVAGPVLMGLFIQSHGVSWAWPLIFLLSLVAAAMMAGLYLWEKRSVKQRR
ncbi:MAG: MFS transporter [Coprothermobacterota bacterium]|nr:MFS transporter [Coprothermobacterota bacterium]